MPPLECPVCYGALAAPFAYRCRHTACRSCARAWHVASGGTIRCPLCRTTGAPPATCVSAPPDPGFGMHPYTSCGPTRLVQVVLGPDTPAAVNVAELRAAPPLPKRWLQVGFVRLPLFRLPGLDAVVDAYTRVRLLNQPPGEPLRLVERPTAPGVHRALPLDPGAPPPAAFATLLARIFRRLAAGGRSPPPGSLVIDLTWDGCTLARAQGLTGADVENAVVAVFARTAPPPGWTAGYATGPKTTERPVPRAGAARWNGVIGGGGDLGKHEE